jgi:hypothetical protein
MLSDCLTLIRAFWKMSVFRIAPQDLPASRMLLVICSLTNLALSTLINQLQLALGSAVLVAVLEMTVLIGLTSALLFYFSHLARLTQALTALMGSGALIGGIVFVLLIIVPQLPEFLRIAIFLWNLLIMAHVLRHSLGVHFVAAFFIAIGYAILLIQIIVFIGRMLSTGIA